MIEEMEIGHKEQDWKTLFRLAHSVKGSASSIGAIDLQKLTHDLEQKCEKGVDDPGFKGVEAEIVDNIRKEYGRVLKSVCSIIDNQKLAIVQSPAESIDIEKLSLSLNDLKKAISQAAPIAIKEKLREAINQVGETNIQKIQNYINDYDYDEALKEINELASRYSIKIE
ncbi:Hpt domain-containing protein, partial [bacterium]|nr:Hpt domain-containing protein [bacterium]